ncbi:hypothetical protein CDAR_88791 [Caerostris darwini]|uniref:Uncharacterized protein n=1 Tax=Caerostris darwini TaxID=1538125 RepID=A0AAV4RVH7_9ARAC|nr:hypothetical protein CDAR_88791 [Caerostris darwini]
MESFRYPRGTDILLPNNYFVGLFIFLTRDISGKKKIPPLPNPFSPLRSLICVPGHGLIERQILFSSGLSLSVQTERSREPMKENPSSPKSIFSPPLSRLSPRTRRDRKADPIFSGSLSLSVQTVRFCRANGSDSLLPDNYFVELFIFLTPDVSEK